MAPTRTCVICCTQLNMSDTVWRSKEQVPTPCPGRSTPAQPRFPAVLVPAHCSSHARTASRFKEVRCPPNPTLCRQAAPSSAGLRSRLRTELTALLAPREAVLRREGGHLLGVRLHRGIPHIAPGQVRPHGYSALPLWQPGSPRSHLEALSLTAPRLPGHLARSGGHREEGWKASWPAGIPWRSGGERTAASDASLLEGQTDHAGCCMGSPFMLCSVLGLQLCATKPVVFMGTVDTLAFMLSWQAFYRANHLSVSLLDVGVDPKV